MAATGFPASKKARTKSTADDSSGEQQRVKTFRVGGVEREVDWNRLTEAFAGPAFDARALRRHEDGLGAGFLEGGARLEEFAFFEAIGAKDGDAFAGEIV
jgi:hypothetical protein